MVDYGTLREILVSARKKLQTRWVRSTEYLPASGGWSDAGYCMVGALRAAAAEILGMDDAWKTVTYSRAAGEYVRSGIMTVAAEGATSVSPSCFAFMGIEAWNDNMGTRETVMASMDAAVNKLDEADEAFQKMVEELFEQTLGMVHAETSPLSESHYMYAHAKAGVYAEGSE